MKISRQGIELTKSFESFSSKIYTCPAGRRTIGYGHLLNIKENYKNLSKIEAYNILKKDIYIAERSVLRNICIELNQNQFDSLVSFTFNVGGAAFQRSTLRQKINYLEVELYEEFMQWVYVRGRKSRGLIHRRAIEANLFLSN